jgi:sigma-B regulation protein RsbU (phosphoserine phosphatase)
VPQPHDPRKSTQALRTIANSIQEQINVKRSLDVASRRQLVMLRAIPEVPGYEFASVYRPAEHVSGDFYDVIDLGGGRYGLIVGDVSGHGMEAGIVMGSARKALQIYARSGEPPTHVLTWGNDDLGPELDRQTFLTAAYSVLDTEAHSLLHVRAGHTPALLFGPGPREWQVIKPGGMMIGVAKGQTFTNSLEEVQLALAPGQALIQYTDGVIEARERGGDEFGVDRLIEYLEKRPAEQPLSGILEGLVAELETWTGGAAQEDDISILAVRRRT